MRKIPALGPLLFAAMLLAGCAVVPIPEPSPAPSTTVAPTTTIAPPSPAVGLLAFGDAGVGTPTQFEVAAQMEAWASGHRTDAVFEVGDVVYEVGDPALFGERIDAPYAALTTSRPFWAALGNHDIKTDNGNGLIAHLGLPGRWYEKVLQRNGVSVQLLVLDSNDVSQTQATWLDQRLSSGSFTWRIVAFHHPAYSCGPHGNTSAVVSTWVPIIRAHSVDLVLSGHDHSYQRFHDGDTTYIVTGGGGAATTTVSACATGAVTDASAVRHHFVGIEASTSDLTVTAVARTGETLDTVTLH